MAINITFNDKDFQKKATELVEKIVPASVRQGIHDVAEEILRLSSFEVPHDTGLLQTSGHTEHKDDESTVGYNKVYAARLHEHPEYRFQKGRKGKYLEDPIKNNLHVFIDYIKSKMPW